MRRSEVLWALSYAANVVCFAGIGGCGSGSGDSQFRPADAGLLSPVTGDPLAKKPEAEDSSSQRSSVPALVDSAPDGGLPQAAPGVDEAGAVRWPTRELAFAQCMVRAARAGYASIEAAPQSICEDLLLINFVHQPALGDDVMKVYQRCAQHEGRNFCDLLLVFAGTRDDTGDRLRDLQSQVLTGYENHFGPDEVDAVELSGAERVGSGFDARWRNHTELASAGLNALRAQSPFAISVVLVGHSLGGVTASRAAFDIARSTTAERVTTWSFNAPRVGNADFARSYVAQLRDCEDADSGCFNIHQFTRTGDAIHGLPFASHHPVWNTDQSEDARQGTGAPGDAMLSYCPHYHAPRDGINPLDNHDLERWSDDLIAMPKTHFDCMF